MPGLLIAEPVDEAVGRDVDIGIGEDRVLQDWARHTTSFGDSDRQQILVSYRLRILRLAKNGEFADSVKTTHRP